MRSSQVCWLGGFKDLLVPFGAAAYPVEVQLVGFRLK